METEVHAHINIRLIGDMYWNIINVVTIRQGDINVQHLKGRTTLLTICLNDPLYCPMAFSLLYEMLEVLKSQAQHIP